MPASSAARARSTNRYHSAGREQRSVVGEADGQGGSGHRGMIPPRPANRARTLARMRRGLVLVTLMVAVAGRVQQLRPSRRHATPSDRPRPPIDEAGRRPVTFDGRTSTSVNLAGTHHHRRPDGVPHRRGGEGGVQARPSERAGRPDERLLHREPDEGPRRAAARRARRPVACSCTSAASTHTEPGAGSAGRRSRHYPALATPTVRDHRSTNGTRRPSVDRAVRSVTR